MLLLTAKGIQLLTIYYSNVYIPIVYEGVDLRINAN